MGEAARPEDSEAAEPQEDSEGEREQRRTGLLTRTYGFSGQRGPTGFRSENQQVTDRLPSLNFSRFQLCARSSPWLPRDVGEEAALS